MAIFDSVVKKMETTGELPEISVSMSLSNETMKYMFIMMLLIVIVAILLIKFLTIFKWDAKLG